MSEDKIARAISEGTLQIGDTILRCAVLNDETRVLTQKTFLQAIGRSGPSGGQAQKGAIANLPFFLSNPKLKPFISDDLARSLSPILFRPLKGSGGRQTTEGGKGGMGYAVGLNATVFADVCCVFVEARDKGQLNSKAQHRIAEKCDRLLRGLAGVGIIALIDEVTGYQYERDRTDLQRILAACVNPVFLPWTERFTQEFFRQLFRLRGWQFSPPQPKKPQFVGKLINDLVYKQLPPGVLETLREKNPANERGRRRYKDHQFLTGDIGNPHLEKQVVAVTTLMKASSNWRNFERSFNRVFPRYKAV